jgi:hypothetical protein
MALSWSMEGAMAGLDDFPDIRRSIDDAVDEAEALPNRYQNTLGSVC